MYLSQQLSLDPSGVFLFLGASVATDTVYFINKDDLVRCYVVMYF